jgi:glycosyltransferase involved in cell wall biosynthesis
MVSTQGVSMERISVVIPAYNAERTLRSTLESVLDQTCGALEVIVVDDGSTDGTESTVKDYAEQGRIKYIKRENGGIAAGRNTGLKACTGDYIALLDHDDLWDSDKIERQVRFIRENGADFVYCYVRRLGLDGKIHAFPVEKLQGATAMDDLLKQNWIYSSTVLFKRSLLNTAGLLDETFRYCEDWDYWLRIGAVARIELMPEYLVTRRDQPTSFSITYPGKYMYYIKLYAKHAGMFDPGRRKTFRKNIGNKCYTDAIKLLKAGRRKNALAAYRVAIGMRAMLIFRLHKFIAQYVETLVSSKASAKEGHRYRPQPGN